MAETKRGGETGVRCVITTPESTVLDTRAEFISVPLFDGQRGIGRGHAPFVGRLGVGGIVHDVHEGTVAVGAHADRDLVALDRMCGSRTRCGLNRMAHRAEQHGRERSCRRASRARIDLGAEPDIVRGGEGVQEVDHAQHAAGQGLLGALRGGTVVGLGRIGQVVPVHLDGARRCAVRIIRIGAGFEGIRIARAGPEPSGPTAWRNATDAQGRSLQAPSGVLLRRAGAACVVG
jgi:hypothetical protein